MNISRKDFLKKAGAFAGLAVLNQPLLKNLRFASLPSGITTPFFVNVILNGGPDIRHLIVPRPSSDVNSYGYHFWFNRSGIYGVGQDYNQWISHYGSAYTEITTNLNGNPPFGILSQAGWLIQEYNNGKVAFVNNVRHSESRDHARSLLVVQSGNYSTPAYATGLTGIGGKLAEYSGGRVLSMTSSLLPFCNNYSSPDSVLSFNNSRNFGLYAPASDTMVNTNGSVSAGRRVTDYRAMYSYYKAKLNDKASMAAHHVKYLSHFEGLDAFTTLIRQRLDANPAPDSIKLLYQSVDGTSSVMADRGFGLQAASLYDAYLTADINKFRVASLSMGGWDSHKWQQRTLEPKFNDLFGENKSFHTIYTEIPTAFEQSIIMFIGDFGRQLKANGADSSDHGDGNTVILMGGHVAGGVYGEMWPASEIAGAEGEKPLQTYHRGIEGRTSLSGLYSGIIPSIAAGQTAATLLPDTAVVHEAGYGDISGIII
jgi:uncharacterized protein (DUF1501 family)